MAVVNPYQEFTVKCWYFFFWKKKNYSVVTLKKVPKWSDTVILFPVLLIRTTFQYATSIFGPLITPRIVSTKKMHTDPFSFPFTFNWRALPCRFASSSLFFLSHFLFALKCEPSFEFHWVSVHKRHVIYAVKKTKWKEITISSISYTHIASICSGKCTAYNKGDSTLFVLCMYFCRQKNFVRWISFMRLLPVKRWECVCVILWYFFFISLLFFIRFIVFYRRKFRWIIVWRMERKSKK